ncbi:hypothetical protein BDD12DRAFT_802807 [Trichophaea hybrida]|nr:hypothetical protein BDD12DRAFT_802807 [Trichophaea hybrida]
MPTIFQDMDTQKEPELLATQTEESDRATLKSKSVLVMPRPPAPPAIAAFIGETIISFPLGWVSEPQPGEKFPTVEDAVRHREVFAFFSGFAFVTASGTAERKRSKCFHHQKQPRNTSVQNGPGRAGPDILRPGPKALYKARPAALSAGFSGLSLAGL